MITTSRMTGKIKPRINARKMRWYGEGSKNLTVRRAALAIQRASSRDYTPADRSELSLGFLQLRHCLAVGRAVVVARSRSAALNGTSNRATLFRRVLLFRDFGGHPQTFFVGVAKMHKAVEPHDIARIESQPGGAEGEAASLNSIPAESNAEPHNKSQAELIADLAHDLRTPFVSIRGYTKMVLEERAGPINSTQREYLSIVAENTTRAIHLLNDLLAAATSQSLCLETMDVRDLWQEARGILKPRAQAKSLRITERIPPEPLLVAGDREMLMEVLAEIFSHTIKFADPGAELFVELSNHDKETITVRISDARAEIPPKFVDTVSRRTNLSGRSRPGAGDGLGTEFSMIREIIQSHGGRISVSNKDESGVGFFVSLPALEAKRI